MALPATNSLPIERPTGHLSSNNVFAALDDRLLAGTRGVVVVRTSSSSSTAAVFGHATRRFAGIGIATIGSPFAGPVPLWRQVAEQLGLSDLPSDPARFAGVVSQAVSGRDLAVVGHLPRGSSWDRAVTRAIAEDPCLVVVLVSEGLDLGTELAATAYELGAQLSLADRKRWWDAVGAAAAVEMQSDDLVRLDDWWSLARRLRTDGQRELPPLTPLAGALLGSLAVAGRAWPRVDLGFLGAGVDELQALQSLGVVSVSRGWVSIEPHWRARAEVEALTLPSQFRADIAHSLERRFPSDPSAHQYAATLLLSIGRREAAEGAHERALELAEDPLAYAEVAAGWEVAVGGLPTSDQLPIAVRAANRSIARADGPAALRWAQLAFASNPESWDLLMLVGRAQMGVGDTTAARSVFDKAGSAAATAAERAEVAGQLAELHLLAGDMKAAVREAGVAMQDEPGAPGAYLDGRNVLGKVMLAESRWDDADRHFASDAFQAGALRFKERELRARSNRAIALLRKRHIDEARAVLESVQKDAEQFRIPRAQLFAADNLALIAWRQQNFAEALHLYEASVTNLRKLGDRSGAPFRVCNLADVRARLGLYDLAEESISFARRLAGPSPEPGRAWRYNYVEGLIALYRGNLNDAARLAARAISDAHEAGNHVLVDEAHVLSARVLVAQGNLVTATELLESVRLDRATLEIAAEVAVLTAAILYAGGERRADLLDKALELCAASGGPALMIEVNCLAAQLAQDLGRRDVAAAHVEQAAAIRDHVARALPIGIRSAFLARRDIMVIDELTATPASVPMAEVGLKAARPLLRNRAANRELVGDDPAVRALRAAIIRVAPSDATVLIHGESGTGKELVAEAIHRASRRADSALVSVNCSALVDTLLLSELFGHEKGAFTGAAARRRGRFEIAEGGTLFLDEIGDISPRAQVSLLRVLQEKSFERVGGTTTLRANVRVVCATHRDLRAMVERGDFREDLYYRLRGVTLELPPLRARLGDIPRISRHLLETIAAERSEAVKALSEDACALLSRHRWPGNIRELDNALRAAALFADGDEISARHLLENVADLRVAAESGAPSRPNLDSTPPPFGGSRPSGQYAIAAADSEADVGRNDSVDHAYAHVRQGRSSLGDLKRQIERDCIARALGECSGNITKAATLLGMKRPRLSQLVKHYGMSVVCSEELT